MIRENSICTAVDDTKYQHKIQLFNKLIATLKSKNLYENFKNEFDFIYIKKAYLVAILTYVVNSEIPNIKTLKSIRNEICNLIPHYQKNKYYKRNLFIRIVDLLFIYFPNIAIKLSKFYARRRRVSF
jgi:hypothetical protein